MKSGTTSATETVLKFDGIMRVTLLRAGNPPLHIDCSRSDTVGTLKNLAYSTELSNASVGAVFVFHGRRMEDQSTLDMYGIVEGSIIHAQLVERYQSPTRAVPVDARKSIDTLSMLLLCIGVGLWLVTLSIDTPPVAKVLLVILSALLYITTRLCSSEPHPRHRE